jgi:hypothetical protein
MSSIRDMHPAMATLFDLHLLGMPELNKLPMIKFGHLVQAHNAQRQVTPTGASLPRHCCTF